MRSFGLPGSEVQGKERPDVTEEHEERYDRVCDELFNRVDIDGSGQIAHREYVRYTLRAAIAKATVRMIDVFHQWCAPPPDLASVAGALRVARRLLEQLLELVVRKQPRAVDLGLAVDVLEAERRAGVDERHRRRLAPSHPLSSYRSGFLEATGGPTCNSLPSIQRSRGA